MLDEKNERGFLAGVSELTKATEKDLLAVIASGIMQLAKPSSSGSRAEFFKYSTSLEKDVAEKIQKGDLQVIDYEIMSIVPVAPGAGKKTINFFTSDQVAKAGIHTLNKGETPKDVNMLVKSIAILAATTAGTSDADILDAAFLSVRTFASLRNAFLNIRANNRLILKDQPLTAFYDTANEKASDQEHRLILDNPKFVLGNEFISAQLEFQDAAGVPANTYVAIKLKGSATMPR